jgi:hypothetical protein
VVVATVAAVAAVVAVAHVEPACQVHAFVVALTVAKNINRAARSAFWNIERVADARIWPREVRRVTRY